FVPGDAFRGPGPADIEAHPDVSLAGQVAVRPPVSRDLVVIFAIRQVLPDRRERSVVGGVGQVQRRAEPHAVRLGNLHLPNDPNRLVGVVPLAHKPNTQLSAFSCRRKAKRSKAVGARPLGAGGVFLAPTFSYVRRVSMPKVRIDDALDLHYELDDYTNPWTTPETILLIHGVADTSKAWFAWVPQLARRFRVLRPDLRGFGQSSVPPRDYQWSLGGLAQDLYGLLKQLQIPDVHLGGQRVGGSVAMQFAHDYPDAVKSLVVIGGPATLSQSSLNPGAWLEQVRREGVESWARSTMGRRLGEVSPAMREWWIQ